MYGRYITNSLVNSNKIIDSQGASGGTGGNGGSDNGVRGDGGNGAIYHMGSFFQDSSYRDITCPMKGSINYLDAFV